MEASHRERIVPLCCGCGRADQRLQAVLRPRSCAKVDPECITTSPEIVWEQTSVTALQFWYEKRYVTDQFCHQCSIWFSAGQECGSSTRNGRKARWAVAWPSKIGHALAGPDSKAIWHFLPPSLRHQWRGLSLKIGFDELSKPTVMDAIEGSKPEVMTMAEFHRAADFDYSTKCGICRGCFPADEVTEVPFIEFLEHDLLVKKNKPKNATNTPQRKMKRPARGRPAATVATVEVAENSDCDVDDPPRTLRPNACGFIAEDHMARSRKGACEQAPSRGASHCWRHQKVLKGYWADILKHTIVRRFVDNVRERISRVRDFEGGDSVGEEGALEYEEDEILEIGTSVPMEAEEIDSQHSEEEIGVHAFMEVDETDEGPNSGLPLPEQPCATPCKEQKKSKQRRCAKLAPLWDEVLRSPLGYDIWTRMVVTEEKGFSVVTCEKCACAPYKAHFFSAAWPLNSLEREHDMSDKNFGGYNVQHMDRTWHWPTSLNLFFLNPVRIHDAAVNGTRVCHRPEGYGNTQFQMLALGGDQRGLSTQFVTLKPHPHIAWKNIPADMDQVVLWEEILSMTRPELQFWFAKRRSEDRQLKPTPEAHLLLPKFKWNREEGSVVSRVKRKTAPFQSAERGKLVLDTGPAGWVLPRNLPKSIQNAVTTAVHMVLGVPHLRRAIANLRPPTNELPVQGTGESPVCPPKASPQCAMAVLSDYVHHLMLGEKYPADGFQQLSKLLKKISNVDVCNAASVFGTFLDWVDVGPNACSNGAGAPCDGLQARVPGYVHAVEDGNNDATSYLHTQMARGWFKGELVARQDSLYVWVDTHSSSCDTHLDLGIPFYGHLPKAVMWLEPGTPGKSFQRWESCVRGRNIRGNSAWFHCKNIDVVEQEDTILRIAPDRHTLLVYTKEDGPLAGGEGAVQHCENRVPFDDDAHSNTSEESREVWIEEELDNGDQLYGGGVCPQDVEVVSVAGLEDGNARRMHTEVEESDQGSDVEHMSEQERYVEEDVHDGDTFVDVDHGYDHDTPGPVLECPNVEEFSMEYLTANHANQSGLHMLLGTLAEMNAKKPKGSSWVRSFVTAVTSRLPELPNIADYVEAHAFVSHFPIRDPETGHYPGCMPLHFYSNSTHEARTNPFVGFEEYVGDVLRDPYSTRAMDPTWCGFAFNVLLMRLLETGPSVNVVRRGLARALDDYTSQKQYDERFGDRVMSTFLHDEQNARCEVEGACAAIKKFQTPTYFMTWAADQRRFPGVAKVYNKIMNDGLDVRYFAVHLQRVFDRANRLFIRYLMEDPSRPIGEIEHIWLNKEFQTDVGNFYHCHALIITKDQVASPNAAEQKKAFATALSRVTAESCGAFSRIIGDQTATGFQGVHPTQESWWEMRARQVQTHKCGQKCTVEDKDGTSRCRFNAPWATHGEGRFREMPVSIPPGLVDLLVAEGLAVTDPATGKVVLCEELSGGAWEPPRGSDDERISPFNPEVFMALNGCHMNLQVVYGSRWVLAYLVKYVAGAEERSLIRLTQASPNTAKAEDVDEHKRKRQEGRSDMGRKKFQTTLISLCEMIFHCLGHARVHSTWDLDHVNVGLPEQRFVVLRRGWKADNRTTPIFGPMAGTGIVDPSGAVIDATRLGVDSVGDPLYPKREPSPTQWDSYNAWHDSRYGADKVTVYTVRPPETLDFEFRAYRELTHVQKDSWKPRFVNQATQERRSRLCNWRAHGLYDLRHERVFLNPEIFSPNYIHLARSLFIHRLEIFEEEFAILCHAVLEGGVRVPWMGRIMMFGARPKVMVPSRYLPTATPAWVLSRILLQAPPFESEEKLVRDTMVSYGVTRMHELGERMIQELNIRNFVLHETMFTPVSYRGMFLVIEKVQSLKVDGLAYSILPDVACTDEEMECAQQGLWERQVSSKMEKHARMLAHLPSWQQADGQSSESWEEQNGGLLCAKERLQLVLGGNMNPKTGLPHMNNLKFARPLYYEGPPGTGKTFVALHVLRVASELLNGLPGDGPIVAWDATALSSHRSIELCSDWIHMMFGFKPGSKRFYTTAHQLAASSLEWLKRRPHRRRLLQSLMVLVIDEFCQVGGQLLTAIDMVLRRVRGNEFPFGGVFVVAAGDHYQNEPVNETPPLKTWFVRYNFDVVSFRHPFRARRCPHLLNVIYAMRVPVMADSPIEGTLDLFEAHCNLVDDEAHVPEDATWLLPKRVAVDEARKKWYDDALSEKTIFTPEDLLLTLGAWRQTNEGKNVRFLDKHSGLARECYTVVGSRIRVQQLFSHRGQAIVNGSSGVVKSFTNNMVNVEIDTPLPMGPIPFSRVTSVVQNSGSMQVKRRQFPLQLDVAQTIHDIQGVTSKRIATYADADWRHIMWSRMMLFTLLTRVEHLKDVTLVRYDRSIMRQILRHQTCWHAEVDAWLQLANILPQYVSRACDDAGAAAHAAGLRNVAQLSFTRPMQFAVAPRGQPVVYVLQAQSGRPELYVGWTNHMEARIAVHNGGKCERTHHRRDWQYVGYVYGFPYTTGKSYEANKFEKTVHQYRWDHTRLLGLIEVVHHLVYLCKIHNEPGATNLRVHWR